ncbi:DUF975 family protein [Lactobacillus hamsteri]|uniref:Integral membrane protein n=1 Tax=Lactobacillus hamsteri DSM 5661 = JCM 6256 TaxID=1423754 RepID=A0A0R1Y8Z9_9LACO|nr:DUF975 family protein [Lactobacillus hamsteri]KRM38842.1 integral membrane protein [Lactobacillus hamsteri DSM 5661 = JCM 6256]
MSRKELKQAAKDQLRGNWVWAICLSLISWLIIYLIDDIESFISTGRDTVYNQVYRFANGSVLTETTSSVSPFSSIFTFVLSILAGILLWGVTYTILQFRDKGDQPNVFKGMFSAYMGDKFTTSFVTYLLFEIFLFLWTLLFIIPGFIKAYSYSMTPYIMKDLYDAGHKPTATEAITKSRKLMNGHKTDLFVLDLSFVGWWLLSVITLGIGFIWVTPYYRQTKANFYRNLAGDQFLKEN